MKRTFTIAAAAIVIAAIAIAAEKKADTKPKKETPVIATEDLSKLSKEELAKKLDPEAYKVCIMGGTERPFDNKYWNNHEKGLYVDVISKKPLFASTHKFDSGSGWPSFFTPVEKDEIVEKADRSLGMVRIEVVAKTSGAHLGHLFDDGMDVKTKQRTPNGMRYCINSAALKFIPATELKAAGFEKYAHLFAEDKKAEPKK